MCILMKQNKTSFIVPTFENFQNLSLELGSGIVFSLWFGNFSSTLLNCKTYCNKLSCIKIEKFPSEVEFAHCGCQCIPLKVYQPIQLPKKKKTFRTYNIVRIVL